MTITISTISSQVEKTVRTDAFVVYPVTSESLVWSSSSWRNNTQLVILETKLEENLLTSVQDYLDGGGKVWDLSDNEGLNHAENFVRETVITAGEMGSVLEDRFNIDINKSGEEEEENPYTAGYLFGDLESLGVSGQIVNQRSLTLDFLPPSRQGSPSERNLPVLPAAGELRAAEFDYSLYAGQLRTEVVGRLLLYVPVITSSMRVLEGSWQCEGLAVVPARQTAGQATGGSAPPAAACSRPRPAISLQTRHHRRGGRRENGGGAGGAGYQDQVAQRHFIVIGIG